MENDTNLKPLFAKIGLSPRDESLYHLAFTHRSCNGPSGTRGVDYERLEFLGDSVVNLVTAELCYILHPEMDSGELSKLRAQFICTKAEADYARKLGLGHYLVIAPTLYLEEMRDADNFLEDIFESFLGAIYLDQGPEYAMDFVRRMLRDKVEKAKIQIEMNPKSTLQEAVQGDGRGDLVYSVLQEWGEPNHKHFVIGVFLDGTELGRGEGKTKKEAERNAASAALSKMVV